MAQWEHKEATWHTAMIQGSEYAGEVTQIMLFEGPSRPNVGHRVNIK